MCLVLLVFPHRVCIQSWLCAQEEKGSVPFKSLVQWGYFLSLHLLYTGESFPHKPLFGFWGSLPPSEALDTDKRGWLVFTYSPASIYKSLSAASCSYPLGYSDFQIWSQEGIVHLIKLAKTMGLFIFCMGHGSLKCLCHLFSTCGM